MHPPKLLGEHYGYVHNLTVDVVLRCITRTFATQRNTRIDLESILAFPALSPCIWSQKIGLELITLVCPKLDATQHNVRPRTNTALVLTPGPQTL